MSRDTLGCVYGYNPYLQRFAYKRCLIYKCRTSKFIKRVCLSAQDTIPKYLKDYWLDIRQVDKDCERRKENVFIILTAARVREVTPGKQHRPGNPSSISRTHMKIKKTNSTKLSFISTNI